MKNKILSVIIAAIATSVVLAILFLIYFFVSITLRGLDGDISVELLILLFLGFFVAFLFKRRNKSYTALGIILPFIILLGLFFYEMIQSIPPKPIDVPFNSLIWSKTEKKPNEMSYTLQRRKGFLNYSQKAIDSLLGEPYFINDWKVDTLQYRYKLESGEKLVFMIVNDTVRDISIIPEGLFDDVKFEIFNLKSR